MLAPARLLCLANQALNITTDICREPRTAARNRGQRLVREGVDGPPELVHTLAQHALAAWENNEVRGRIGLDRLQRDRLQLTIPIPAI